VLNGRMDLLQAEAVADLIDARTRAMQQQALQQARYLLQQQPLAPLTVLAPGPSLGLLLGQRFAQPPGQQLQQPTSASQLAANAFAPFR